MLFPVGIFFTTLYSDCEDGMRSGTVEIHVCGTYMPCLKMKKKNIYIYAVKGFCVQLCKQGLNFFNDHKTFVWPLCLPHCQTEKDCLFGIKSWDKTNVTTEHPQFLGSYNSQTNQTIHMHHCWTLPSIQRHWHKQVINLLSFQTNFFPWSVLLELGCMFIS